MRVNGTVLDIPAREIREGDVVILSGGFPVLRYVSSEPRVTLDGPDRLVVMFRVAVDGREVGTWTLDADLLHVAVIRQTS